MGVEPVATRNIRVLFLSLLVAVCTSSCEQEQSGARAAAPAKAPASLFTDVTATMGINFQATSGAHGKWRIIECMTSGGGFLDYDGDGDLDIYLTQANNLDKVDPSLTSRLYRNDGNRFTDVTSATGTGLVAFAMGCAAADYDNDRLTGFASSENCSALRDLIIGTRCRGDICSGIRN